VSADVEAEELPVFRALSPSTRANLLANAIVHRVGFGAVLFEQGEAPDFQHVTMSGSAQLFARSAEGREVLIEVVRAPDLVIPAAVAIGAPYLMQARVPERSRFLLIPAKAFREAVATEPLLAQAVIRDLAQQFRRMVRQVKNLKLRSSTQRVGCYILALSARQGTPDRAVLPYEKSFIASELGMTPMSFTRALSSLGELGVKVEGQTITIADGSRLAAEFTLDPLIDGADANGLRI
jgi:CRP/FNR family transcriptional activator FtrB